MHGGDYQVRTLSNWTPGNPIRLPRKIAESEIRVSDSLTKSRMPDSDFSQTVVFAQQQAADPHLKPGAIDKTPKAPSAEIQAWVSAADTTGNIMGRGYYDYAASCGPWKGPRICRVEYALRIQGNQILGNSQDNIGHANIRGIFDPTRRSVCFIKHYYAPESKTHLKWEYIGCFTPCGIVGEWRYPGDPAEKRQWRGKFGIWLQKDEDAKGTELESQMELLSIKGQLLTRSLTGIS